MFLPMNLQEEGLPGRQLHLRTAAPAVRRPGLPLRLLQGGRRGRQTNALQHGMPVQALDTREAEGKSAEGRLQPLTYCVC